MNCTKDVVLTNKWTKSIAAAKDADTLVIGALVNVDAPDHMADKTE